MTGSASASRWSRARTSSPACSSGRTCRPASMRSASSRRPTMCSATRRRGERGELIWLEHGDERATTRRSASSTVATTSLRPRSGSRALADAAGRRLSGSLRQPSADRGPPMNVREAIERPDSCRSPARPFSTPARPAGSAPRRRCSSCAPAPGSSRSTMIIARSRRLLERAAGERLDGLVMCEAGPFRTSRSCAAGSTPARPRPAASTSSSTMPRSIPSKPFEQFTIEEHPGGPARQCRCRHRLRAGRPAAHAAKGLGPHRQRDHRSPSMAAGPTLRPMCSRRAR